MVMTNAAVPYVRLLQTKKAKIVRMAQEQALSWDEGVLQDGLKIVVLKYMFKPQDFSGGLLWGCL